MSNKRPKKHHKNQKVPKHEPNCQSWYVVYVAKQNIDSSVWILVFFGFRAAFLSFGKDPSIMNPDQFHHIFKSHVDKSISFLNWRIFGFVRLNEFLVNLALIFVHLSFPLRLTRMLYTLYIMKDEVLPMINSDFIHSKNTLQKYPFLICPFCDRGIAKNK